MTTDTTTKGVGAIGRGRASVAAIETLATIRAQARTVATDAEKVTLSGWSGWGPLARAFAPKEQAWADMGDTINAVLPEADVRMGMKGTYMAFYTPRDLAAAMWDMLRSFGYTGGPVAELGCGGGAFFATAPEGTPLVGVERDPTAAAICTLLNPGVRVINGGLEDTPLRSNFAAVIGNVPFGDVKVFDPTAPADVTGSLHNYFIWRAVRALAPGGYAVLLTSRYTMDAWQEDARAVIDDDADLVGAVRLPNGALGGGTDAAADIVILRRKGGTKKQVHGQSWMRTEAPAFDAFAKVNRWWGEQPGSVLGTMKKGTTSQYGQGLVVEAHEGGPALIDRLLSYTRKTLVPDARERNLLWTAPRGVEAFDAAGVISKEGWHEGSMRFSDDGGVLVVKDGRAQPLPAPGQELLRLLRLRDLAVDLIAAEADYTRTDTSIEPIRADIRAAYQDYVKHHGPLNRYTQRPAGVDADTGATQWQRRFPTMQGFRHDPDAPLVFALEVFADDDEGDSDETDAGSLASPAPIQSSRQNLPPVEHTHTDDPAQALAWSLDKFAGRVRIDYIAAMLGRPLPNEPLIAKAAAREEVAGLLGDKVLLDPTTREWLTAEEYLSGDVRAKHLAAETAAVHDPQFTRNVTALAGVLPVWLGPAEITTNMNAPWIGPAELELFLAEVIGYTVKVRRAAGQWEIDTQSTLRHSVAASAQWGTEHVDAFTLVQLALNGKTPTVKREVVSADGLSSRSVKDAEKSMLAGEKQQQLRARFDEWIWEDSDRADRLVNLYNRRYNNLVARTFDGSHVTVDGMAPWFDPYDHQLQFVARAVATPAALCGLPVGSGKTNIMAMVVMKLKQLGLVRKPMIVVPNHLLEQIDREIRQLFPAAKILTGASKTISANRLAFTARCTTGDWDIVLVTHSAFNAMDVSADTQALYIEDQEEALYEGTIEGAGGKLAGRMVKALAKQLDRLRAEVRSLRNTVRPRDAGVLFEQLGVDYVAVDEFHYYKNLATPVRTEGFSVRPSKRATDLDMKLRYLSARNNGGPHAALFSGTPISNTMLELYVCLHYTMREHLKRIGLGSADQWAAAYVKFETTVEVTVDGGNFQMRTRPSLFVNAPELRVLLSQTADIRTADQLGLKRPTADLRVVAVEPTELQAWFSADLVDRAETVQNKGVEPDVDNMLKICTDGRRMATDPNLVYMSDDGDYKLVVAARTIIDVWKAHPGKLQMGFLDMGTPKTRKGDDGSWVDPQSYGRLRRMLTDAGMDVGRIRFIHDAKDDASKARLFRDCRNGKVDVILGSTDKLGVGTNVQKLIVALHHFDAPFRPSDVEQRDGRALRPGNIHKSVLIFRYVTKRTFDAYMWQMLTRKLRFISQMLSGNLDRTVEDVTGDDVMSYAAIKATATDQPLLQEKVLVESTVKKLLISERSHRQTVARMRKDGPKLRRAAATKAAQAKAWEAIAAGADGVDLSDDGDTAELVFAGMERFRYYSPPIKIGGLTIGWRVWHTRSEESEVQPLLFIDGGDGAIEEECYRFWKVGDVKRRLRKLLGTAANMAGLLREAEAKMRAEAGSSDTFAEKPFEQAADLATARARLDQIEAALREAASKNDATSADDIVIPADPGADIDDDAFAGFAGMMVADLETEVADSMAALMQDGLFQ